MDLSLEQQKLAWREADQLISILRAWGIMYLVGEHNIDDQLEQVSPTNLLKRLAKCVYPRVRDAMITLFLLHPELASKDHIVSLIPNNLSLVTLLHVNYLNRDNVLLLTSLTKKD